MMNVYFLCVLIVTLTLDPGNCNDDMVGLSSKVDQLVSKVDYLLNKTNQLSEDNQLLTDENKKIKEVNQYLSQSVQRLLNTSNKIQEENQGLLSSVDQLVYTSNTIKGANQLLSNKLQQVNGRVQQVTDQLETRSAFSAYMTSGYLTPSSAVTVPFENVHLNLGNHYDSGTSTYTCPVDGVYFFIYTVYSAVLKKSGKYRLDAYLVIDDNTINYAQCYTETSEYITCQSTNSVAIHCNQGSEVKVKVDGGSKIYGDKRNTFSGFLLYGS